MTMRRNLKCPSYRLITAVGALADGEAKARISMLQPYILCCPRIQRCADGGSDSLGIYARSTFHRLLHQFMFAHSSRRITPRVWTDRKIDDVLGIVELQIAAAGVAQRRAVRMQTVADDGGDIRLDVVERTMPDAREDAEALTCGALKRVSPVVPSSPSDARRADRRARAVGLTRPADLVRPALGVVDDGLQRLVRQTDVTQVIIASCPAGPSLSRAITGLTASISAARLSERCALGRLPWRCRGHPACGSRGCHSSRSVRNGRAVEREVGVLVNELVEHGGVALLVRKVSFV